MQANPAASRTTSSPRPGELVVVVSVPSALIVEGEIPQPRKGWSEAEILNRVLYKNTPQWMDKTLVASGYGEYEFLINRGGGETIEFLFGKPKTKEEATKPFESYWKKHGNHRWPPILKSLEIIEDTSMPRTANVIKNGEAGIVIGPTYFDKYVYIPDCNEGSKFWFEEFVSPVPFNLPNYRVPVATAVQFSVPGLSGGFQESLHDDINIPDTRSASSTLFASSSQAASGFVSGQSFPKTNFKTWLPYVVYDEQKQDETGLWYRQRIRVFPPMRPRAIRR
jgi:hypothetical protein